MLELVFAPAAAYMKKTDDEILQSTMEELELLFPEESERTDLWRRLSSLQHA
jgi:hypothetical protein